MKQCSKCGAFKARIEFHKNNSKGDGLQARCKACNIASVRTWQKLNPERETERQLRRNAAARKSTVLTCQNDWQGGIA